MRFRVLLADSAKAEAHAIYEWVISQAPGRGESWFQALLDAHYSLENQPLFCPLAREAAEARRAVRCLLFGKRRGVYRILYEVDAARPIVWILHIRHGALRDLHPSELACPEEREE